MPHIDETPPPASDASLPSTLARDTEVTAAVAAHAAASDPHTGYQKESEKGQASGYAGLDGSGTVPDAQLPAALARDTEVTTAVAAEASARSAADALLVPKSLYDAQTILAAITDDTPAAITMGASTILARLASGNIKAASVAEIKTLLGAGAASGLATLDSSTQVVEPPAAHALVGSKRHTDPRRPSGIISENYPRSQGTSNQSGILASGAILFQAIPLEAGMVLTKLGAHIATTALTRGSNGDSHAWLCLIDPALALVAETADDTSGAVGANAWYEKSIATIASGASGSYTVATTGLHWLGLLLNIGTGGSPAIATLGGLTSTSNFLNLDAPTLCFADTASTYTTPPAFPFTATKSAFKGVVNHVRVTGS